jgi:phosphatidate cytidylyltransferase
MKILIFIILIHVLLGAAGIAFANKKLPAPERKKNWLKYSFYFLICFTVLGSVFVEKPYFLGVFMLISSVSLLELLKLGKQPQIRFPGRKAITDGLFVFSAVSLLFSAFVLLPWQIIAFTYTVVVIFDGSSQIAGQLAGKRQILPQLSPGKTLEGALGGLASAVISTAFLHSLIEKSVFQTVLLAAAVCICAFAGDMAASAYKRAFGAKDFGTILPGQGGMLDRFDSFLVAGAVVGLQGLISGLSFRGMNTDIAVYLGYSMFNINILFAGEMIHRFYKVKAEYSRMFSHFIIGIFSVFIPFLFNSGWYVAAFCIHSALFIYLTGKAGILESHNRVKRRTDGSFYFFFGILGTYIISLAAHNKLLFAVPAAVLAISDPAAALAGITAGSRKWSVYFGGNSEKTVLGTFIFFVTCLMILFTAFRFCNLLPGYGIAVLTAVSAIAALTELISPRGSDNLTVPVVISIILLVL